MTDAPLDPLGPLDVAREGAPTLTAETGGEFLRRAVDEIRFDCERLYPEHVTIADVMDSVANWLQTEAVTWEEVFAGAQARAALDESGETCCENCYTATSVEIADWATRHALKVARIFLFEADQAAQVQGA